MDQLTGKADIYINGAYFDNTTDGASITGPAGIENTPVMNSRGQTAGYISKPIPGTIKASFLHGPDFDIGVFTLPGISLVFACDNGVNYLMAPGIFAKEDGLDSSKGALPITFNGDIVRI